MSALYGLHPARFARRDPKDKANYEEVEVPWLLAVWPSYMARIAPEPVWEENCRGQMERVYPDGQIFSLTERGVPTGWLLMAEEEVYPYVSPEDEIADILAEELMKEINNEIIQKIDAFGFRRQAHFQTPETVTFPGTSIIKPDPNELPPGLVLEKNLVEERLTEMGVIGVGARAHQLRTEWAIDMGYGKAPTSTSLLRPMKKVGDEI